MNISIDFGKLYLFLFLIILIISSCENTIKLKLVGTHWYIKHNKNIFVFIYCGLKVIIVQNDDIVFSWEGFLRFYFFACKEATSVKIKMVMI